MDQFEYKGLEFHYHKSSMRDKVNMAVFKELGYQGTHFLVYIMGEINQKKGYYFDCNQSNISDFLRFELCETDRRKVKFFQSVVDILIKEKVFDQELYETKGILTSIKLQKNFFRATKRRKYTGTEPFPYLYPETIEYIKKIHKIEDQEVPKTDENTADIYDDIMNNITQSDRIDNTIKAVEKQNLNTEFTPNVQDENISSTKNLHDVSKTCTNYVQEKTIQTFDNQVNEPKIAFENVVHDVLHDVNQFTIFEKERVKEKDKVKEKLFFLKTTFFDFYFTANYVCEDSIFLDFEFLQKISDKDFIVDETKKTHPCRNYFMQMHQAFFKIPYLNDKEGNAALKQILVFTEKALEINNLNDYKYIRLLLVWQYILKNWHKLAPSMMQQTSFVGIKNNLNVIFERLKVFELPTDENTQPSSVINTEKHSFLAIWENRFNKILTKHIEHNKHFGDIEQKIMDFLEQNGIENEKLKQKASEIFEYILSNWDKLNDFKRSKIYPNLISHYLPEILIDLKIKKIESSTEIAQKSELFEQFMNVYEQFFTKQCGGILPPANDKYDDAGLKKLIQDFVKMAKDKYPNKSEAELHESSVMGWRYILNDWDKLSNFYKNQIKISQISNNISNIINIQKNGTSKSEIETRTDSITEYGKNLYLDIARMSGQEL